jgi:hypothetical protein
MNANQINIKLAAARIKYKQNQIIKQTANFTPME